MGKKQPTVTTPTGVPVKEKTFSLRDKTYRIVVQGDDIKVYLGTELVFDKFNSKSSYIEWLKKLKGK